MASIASEILQDIVNTLRDSGVFELVTLGEEESATGVPRAAVVFDGLESFVPDDTDCCRWQRLTARVKVHTRAMHASQAVTRLSELCLSARAAILADPYRTQQCCDLPIGRATEITRIEPMPGIRRPEAEATFALQCHFEVEEAA